MIQTAKKLSALILVIVAMTIASPSLAATAKKPVPKIPDYAAKKIIASDPTSELNRLEVYGYTIGFKNTGALNWQNDGAKALTIKTTQKIKKEHWFASPAWQDKLAAASMT